MKEQLHRAHEILHKKQATIHDVANLAGVSVSTVSRVFNGLDRVSDATRKKVQQAMMELNYSPSIIASSMITGRTRMILIMVPDFENPYYSTVVDGINAHLQQFGYYSLVVAHKNYSQKSYLQIQSKFDKIIDGIIVLPEGNFQFFQNWYKPCVMVDRYIENLSLNMVITANFQGAHILTEELVLSGHRKIAIITENAQSKNITDRLGGYLSVLKDYDIPVREEYIIKKPFSIANGRQGLIELLQLPDPPTAVFAANNLACIGCIQVCHERGLRIGEDISLVGYDDHDLAQYASPGITVISQPAFKMGQQAAANLLTQIEGDTIAPTTQVMDVSLIRRNSIKKLN